MWYLSEKKTKFKKMSRLIIGASWRRRLFCVTERSRPYQVAAKIAALQIPYKPKHRPFIFPTCCTINDQTVYFRCETQEQAELLCHELGK